MNFKIIGGVLASAIILVAITAVNVKQNKGIGSETIDIGAILPITGDFAMFGESINQGALLAVEELKEKGYLIRYVSEDDKSTAAGSVNAASKLLNVDKIDAVITATVQEVKPVKNQFDAGHTPLLVVWDSNDYIKSAGPNIFTIGFSTEDAGYQLAAYSHKQGAQKVAIISQKDEWSELIASAYNTRSKDLMLEVVLNESVQPTVKDFRSQIAKIVSEKADAVFIPFLPGAIGPFINQARQLGYKGLILSGDSFSMDEVSVAGENAEGVVFANLHSTGADDLGEAYEKRFGAKPTDALFVTFGYNGVKTLVAAVELAQKEKLSVSELLRRTKVEGVDGMINFSGRNYSEKLEKLYKVENGALVEVN